VIKVVFGVRRYPNGFGLQWGKRSLNKEEMEMLFRVFRNSIALCNVRVIEGFAGIYSITDRFKTFTS
jgi:hypothetical protein